MNNEPVPEPEDPAPEQTAGDAGSRMARLLGFLRSLAGLPTNGSARSELEQVLDADEGRGGAFSPEERTMLRAVLKLGDLRVDDVMVPRASIDAVDAEISVGDLMSAFRKAGHSRMPVYRESLDDPIGMAHIKDVMGWIADTADQADKRNGTNTPFDLSAVDLQQTLTAANIIRPILFVPPSMPVRMLLERMQASRTQMALVIDEYGGTDGLVSLEDLVETIFGEIEDEHDVDEEFTIREISDGQYEADARALVEDACEVISPSFKTGDDADIDTIGGLIYAAISRIPVPGEILHIVNGFEIEILDADPRRIRTVRIRGRRKPKAAARARGRTASEAAPAKIPAKAPEATDNAAAAAKEARAGKATRPDRG